MRAGVNWRKNLYDVWVIGSGIWALYVLLPFFPKYPKTYWPFWPFDAEAVFETAIFLIIPPLAVFILGANLVWFVARVR